MIINMNKNFYPINLQEETICTTIKEMNKSNEIKKFVENIKIHLLISFLYNTTK